jgi:hypothetical protein
LSSNFIKFLPSENIIQCADIKERRAIPEERKKNPNEKLGMFKVYRQVVIAVIKFVKMFI